MPLRHAAIITAAGSSQRFNSQSGSKLKKEFEILGKESVLCRAVRPFLNVQGLAAIVVTYRKGELENTREAIGDLGFDITFVEGGATRQESVFNGLR